MRLKAGPNLIRQTITQLWQYNFFIQKPYKIENIFLTIFKYIYLIKIFLITFRNSKIYLNNKKLKEKIKQNSYLLPDFSNLKLLNFYFEKKNKNLIIFCNIFSRTNFFTEFNNRLKNKNILFLLEKKLKKNLYTHNFIKKFIYRLPKQLKQKNTKNIPQKFLNCFLLKKIKNNIKKKTALKKNKIFWKKYQILNRIVLRPINTLKKNKKKFIIIKTQKIKKKLNKKKLKTTVINYFKINFFLLKKKNKKIKTFLTFLKKNINSRKPIKLNKNKLFIMNWNWQKTKKIGILTKKKNIINPFFINLKKKKKNFIFLTLFIYNQFFNKILEQNLIYFLEKTYLKNLNQNNLKIKLQQPQTFSKLLLNLKNFFPAFSKKTTFLKTNKKSYKNLLHLIPNIEIFQNMQNFNKQIAIELARTKKYWRIIKSIEILLIKFFIQMWESFKIKSQISGIKIIITGRPGKKSTRTQKIFLKFGHYKQTTFATVNTNKTFEAANAKIGTFGITILLTF